ncbi:MAG: ribosome maturation factor RimM [Desulfobulbaceae bacterium]|nr:ribosome maturation factor RimM [Desulfobulbaceae bacterium]
MDAAGADAGDFILLGKISKPHGTRGELKIYPYSRQPENFMAYSRIWVAPDSGDKEFIPYVVEQSRVQGKLALLKLAGCSTREDAEELVGSEIWLRRKDLPDLNEAEYYWLDLKDKKAVTEDGRELGKITAIFETGGHDILSVTGSSREYLIPVHEEFIVRIEEFEVVLKLPPGLLEMNK